MESNYTLPSSEYRRNDQTVYYSIGILSARPIYEKLAAYSEKHGDMQFEDALHRASLVVTSFCHTRNAHTLYHLLDLLQQTHDEQQRCKGQQLL